METETTNSVVQTTVSSFNRVTPFSKYVAMALFIILPFVGFWVGYTFSEQPSVTLEGSSSGMEEVVAQTPVTEEPLDSLGIDLPKNSMLVSARTEVLKGYYVKKSSGEPSDTCEVFVVTEGDLSMFYETLEGGSRKSVDQSRLPYDLKLGSVSDAGTEFDMLSENTRSVLTASSPTNQVYIAVTNYESTGGKGKMECEGDFEHMQAISPGWIQ